MLKLDFKKVNTQQNSWQSSEINSYGANHACSNNIQLFTQQIQGESCLKAELALYCIM
jgi:hypothetical protein